jgi:hypothetical protein
VNEAEQIKLKISDLTARFHKAEQAVATKHQKIKLIDKFDRGDIWKDESLPPWIPTPVINDVRYTRTLKRANLASAIPMAHFTAREQKYAEKMEKLQRAYEHVWTTEKVPRVIRRCIDRSLLHGISIAVVYTDDTYVGGTYVGENSPENALYQGKICVKRYPITSFYLDPDAFYMYDAKYAVCVENMALSTVKNNKKFRQYVEKNGNLEKFKALNHDVLAATDTETGQVLDRENGPGKQGQNVLGDENVTVHIHYERFLNDDGRWQLNKYYYIPGMDFFLYVEEDEQPSVYPFAVLYDEEEENDFLGTSTAEGIIDNSKIINRTAMIASVIGVLHQNPQKVVSRESGINAQDLARTGTLPGKVWTANGDPTKAIHHNEPPDIPKGLFDLQDRMSQNLKEFVGINEAYTGQSVGSLTTSTGVNALIERATIRDKDKMIQIDDFVEQISNLIILNILYKWKDKRPIVTKGANGKPVYEEYEPFDKTTIDNLDWICKADTYSVAPTTQALRKQAADNLMNMQGQFQFDPPIITPEEWLRMQDFDQKDQILQRMTSDRQRMEAQKALDSAQKMVQIADVIRQNIAQGMSQEQALQAAQEAAQQLLDQDAKADRKNGRQRDAAKSNGPVGTTGATAMQAMAKGY